MRLRDIKAACQIALDERCEQINMTHEQKETFSIGFLTGFAAGMDAAEPITEERNES